MAQLRWVFTLPNLGVRPQMRPFIERLSMMADCFVFCYPNAGLPNAMGGYDEKP